MRVHTAVCGGALFDIYDRCTPTKLHLQSDRWGCVGSEKDRIVASSSAHPSAEATTHGLT
jgi:hypothetical protein